MNLPATVTDDTDAIFARKVREFRQSRGMTQQQLADAMTEAGYRMHPSAIAKIEAGCRMWRSTIGKIENRERLVTVGEAVQLASILCVPLTDLVADSPTAAPQWSPLHAQRVAQDARDLHRRILSLRDQAARAASLAELVSALADQAVSAGQDGAS